MGNPTNSDVKIHCLKIVCVERWKGKIEILIVALSNVRYVRTTVARSASTARANMSTWQMLQPDTITVEKRWRACHRSETRRFTADSLRFCSHEIRVATWGRLERGVNRHAYMHTCTLVASSTSFQSICDDTPIGRHSYRSGTQTQARETRHCNIAPFGQTWSPCHRYLDANFEPRFQPSSF